MDLSHLPPGTQIIEDVAGKQLVLAPQPSADPNQPLNWSKGRKAVHLTVLSFYTLMAFAFLQVSVPMWSIFKDDLGLSYDILNNGFALSQVTLATGCIIFIPLAARFGRRPVYIFSGLVLIASGIWSCKMKTAGDNYGSSIILGLGSCVNEALFQVSVADLFFVHQRGTINGIYIAVQMIGTYLTPVASGYAAVSRIGWRGTFVVSTIIMGVCVAIMIFFLEETKYLPRTTQGQVIFREDSGSIAIDKTLRDTTRTNGSKNISEDNIDASKADTERRIAASESTVCNAQGRRISVDYSIPMAGLRTRLALVTTTPKGHSVTRVCESLTRPFVILFTFPAVLFTAIQYGFLLAMICILSITQTQLYSSPPYNLSAAGIGNMNIAPAIGCILGSIYGGPVNDYCIRRVARKREGVYEPETRLYMFFFPGIFLSAGVLLYGLTLAEGMPWPVNAVGAGFIGFGLGGCGDIVLTYCQDCYQHIIGDALTGVVFVRNIVSCPIVFAINPWMAGMGVYNMFVMLGCFAVAIILTAVPLVVWGRIWRIKSGSKYMRYSEKTYD